MYDLLILADAEDDLKRLDEINPELLTGELSGFFKLRVGNYRVIYKAIKNENLIVIHCIGHRREVYR